jgi:hypothetical protein
MTRTVLCLLPVRPGVLRGSLKRVGIECGLNMERGQLPLMTSARRHQPTCHSVRAEVHVDAAVAATALRRATACSLAASGRSMWRIEPTNESRELSIQPASRRPPRWHDPRAHSVDGTASGWLLLHRCRGTQARSRVGVSRET